MRIESAQQKYLNEVFGLDNGDLAKVRDELQRQGLEFMAVAANEARILQFLIRGFQVKKVLELGTLFGYSALAMAQVLPKDGMLLTAEKNPTNFAIAQKNFAAASALDAGKIRQILGDARETLKQAEEHGPFDMVFIDANKGAYSDYLTWAEKNVRQGGLIVGDNTFLFGAVWGESRNPDVGPGQVRAMREFNLRLSDPSRYNSIIIPSQEGMTVAQKLF